MTDKEAVKARWLLIFLGLIAVSYVSLCLTPSHYSLGLKLLVSVPKRVE
jgi:hypothetical protein